MRFVEHAVAVVLCFLLALLLILGTAIASARYIALSPRTIRAVNSDEAVLPALIADWQAALKAVEAEHAEYFAEWKAEWDAARAEAEAAGEEFDDEGMTEQDFVIVTVDPALLNTEEARALALDYNTQIGLWWAEGLHQENLAETPVPDKTALQTLLHSAGIEDADALLRCSQALRDATLPYTDFFMAGLVGGYRGFTVSRFTKGIVADLLEGLNIDQLVPKVLALFCLGVLVLVVLIVLLTRDGQSTMAAFAGVFGGVFAGLATLGVLLWRVAPPTLLDVLPATIRQEFTMVLSRTLTPILALGIAGAVLCTVLMAASARLRKKYKVA